MTAQQSSAHPPAEGFRVELPFPPLLESWERSDHPAQVKLARYREAIAALTAPALEQLEPPLALGFHVAGGSDIATGCDLDNFLTPVVKALGGAAKFAFVWAIRGHASEKSSVTLLRATDARLDMAGHPGARGGADLRDGDESRLEGGACGRRRPTRERARERDDRARHPLRRFAAENWLTLWKPSIDALGGILGEGNHSWHPRDDRISVLVLERQLRPELGWDVELDMWWAER